MQVLVQVSGMSAYPRVLHATCRTTQHNSGTRYGELVLPPVSDGFMPPELSSDGREVYSTRRTGVCVQCAWGWAWMRMCVGIWGAASASSEHPQASVEEPPWCGIV